MLLEHNRWGCWRLEKILYRCSGARKGRCTWVSWLYGMNRTLTRFIARGIRARRSRTESVFGINVHVPTRFHCTHAFNAQFIPGAFVLETRWNFVTLNSKKRDFSFDERHRHGFVVILGHLWIYRQTEFYLFSAARISNYRSKTVRIGFCKLNMVRIGFRES